MQFTKMQALGNDFCVFGSPNGNALPQKDIIKLMCNRHYGVGCDCAVYISRSTVADYFMHVYNPDGFEAEMCGNALRCSSKYVCDSGFFSKRTLVVETASGTRAVNVTGDTVCAEIGKATIIEKNVVVVAGVAFRYVYVSVGNPHCVVFPSNLSDYEFSFFGKAIENHPNFPNGTNVEFITAINAEDISMRVWERGIGETLSCATGSCACAAAVGAIYGPKRIYRVKQPGGTLEVEHRDSGSMFINGECKNVFKGTLL